MYKIDGKKEKVLSRICFLTEKCKEFHFTETFLQITFIFFREFEDGCIFLNVKNQ